jgi:hypothetical protein
MPFESDTDDMNLSIARRSNNGGQKGYQRKDQENL